MSQSQLIGTQIGNYLLTQSLGTGGQAEVYLGEHVLGAQHVNLQTQVAVKVFTKTSLAADEQSDFVKEAQIISQLRHPHIVQLKDFGIEHGQPYLVLEYAPNGTLRKRYHRGTPLPVDIVVSYVEQIASALQAAHDKNIIHRDIKPENILLGKQNELLLSDFGIANVIRSTTQNVAGTLYYMAPEVFNGHPLPATDQYALGVLAYEWLCGSLPYVGPNQNVIIGQIMQGNPPPLQSRVQGVSPAIEQVVFTAMNREVHKRFPSVIDFANALQQTYQIAMNPLPVNPDETTEKKISYFQMGQQPYPQQPQSPKPQYYPPQLTTSKQYAITRGRSLFGDFLSFKFKSVDSLFLLWGWGGDILLSIILALSSLAFDFGQLAWWVWLLSLFVTVLLRRWCTSTEIKSVAQILAVSLAAYWSVVVYTFGSAMDKKVHFICAPPPGILAVLALIVASFLHLKYVRDKYRGR